MHVDKFIAAVDAEIEKLIAREAEGPSVAGQNALHLLLENREHVLELCKETEAEAKPSILDRL